MARVFRALTYERQAPKPFFNLPKALNLGPKGPSSQLQRLKMLFFNAKMTIHPIVIKWVNRRGISKSAFLIANVRANGWNKKTILVLELDLGKDPGEARDQDELEGKKMF